MSLPRQVTEVMGLFMTKVVAMQSPPLEGRFSLLSSPVPTGRLFFFFFNGSRRKSLRFREVCVGRPPCRLERIGLPLNLTGRGNSSSAQLTGFWENHLPKGQVSLSRTLAHARLRLCGLLLTTKAELFLALRPLKKPLETCRRARWATSACCGAHPATWQCSWPADPGSLAWSRACWSPSVLCTWG